MHGDSGDRKHWRMMLIKGCGRFSVGESTVTLPASPSRNHVIKIKDLKPVRNFLFNSVPHQTGS